MSPPSESSHLETSPPCGGDPAESVASEERIDHLDRLPDSILLVVFNMIADVKSLGRCSVVSRRFHSLVPQVHSVLVRVDCVISEDEDTSFSSSSSVSDKPRGVFSHLARLVLKPLQTLTQILTSSSSSKKPVSSTSTDVYHHSLTQVLANFKEIRRLCIQLPDAELAVEDGVLLKWRAQFGSTLDSCVILGASSKSLNPNPNSQESGGDADDTGSIPESFYTNGSLKLRVVWTISALIAASARHFLLQQIITEHDTLESVELTDADGQGVLSMDKGQLQEVRVKPVSPSGMSHRTLVPALNMRLWYAPDLELPGGVVLKGATLVAILPSEQPREMNLGSDGCLVSSAFEEPYRTAVRLLVKRRTYCLEMNSF